jgi:hypothetical protein
MQRKSWIALAAGSFVVGLLGGWFSASYRADTYNERYTMDVLSNARYVQAKERAALIRLLEGKEIQKAEDLLYIVLGGNFKDYASSVDGDKRTKACELLDTLGPGFVGATSEAGPAELKSRGLLLEAIRVATINCGRR